MTDETEVEEEVVEDEQQSGEDGDLEAEARSMGWVPKDEFKGPESQWRDAEEFVERGKSVLPIVNSRLKKELEKNSRLETKFEQMRADWEQRFDSLQKMSERTARLTEKRIRAEYERAKEDAVERGDTDAYRAATKAEAEALKSLSEHTEGAEPQKKAPDVPPSIKKVVEEWRDENTWYGKNKQMTALADALHEDLLEEMPGMTIKQNLAKVREGVMEKFPEKFVVEDKPKKTSKVEGGSRASGGGSSLMSKLPPEAKKAIESESMGWKVYLKPGEDPDKNESAARERWVREYFDQPGV